LIAHRIAIIILLSGLHSPAILLNEIEHTVPGNGGQSTESDFEH
jgi:hypothetical protein